MLYKLAIKGIVYLFVAPIDSFRPNSSYTVAYFVNTVPPPSFPPLSAFNNKLEAEIEAEVEKEVEKEE